MCSNDNFFYSFWRYCAGKCSIDFPEDGRSIIFGKSVLIVHNKCSQADIAHNSVNFSHNEQQTRTKKHFETNSCLNASILQFSCNSINIIFGIKRCQKC